MSITHFYFSCWRAVLTEPKTFRLLVLPWQCRAAVLPRLGGYMRLVGNRARTASLNWPKGYSLPYVMLNNKTGELTLGSTLLGSWLGIDHWVARNSVACHLFCKCTSLYIEIIIITIVFPLLIFHGKWFVFQSMSSTNYFSIFWFSLPSHWVKGVSEWLSV